MQDNRKDGVKQKPSLGSIVSGGETVDKHNLGLLGADESLHWASGHSPGDLTYFEAFTGDLAGHGSCRSVGNCNIRPSNGQQIHQDTGILRWRDQ